MMKQIVVWCGGYAASCEARAPDIRLPNIRPFIALQKAYRYSI